MSQVNSAAQRSERNASSGPSYIWEAPGKPVAARFPLALIDRIEREAVENFRSIEAKGTEIGGLLFGSSSPGTPAQVTIEDYEAIPSDYSRGPLYRLSETDLARFDEAAERRHSDGGLRVIGFFRSHTRKGLGLDADDMAVLEARFGDPLQIALLVHPFATKPTAAGIFIWEDGKMRGESSYLEFPFQSSQLAGRSVAEAPPAKQSAQPAAGSPRPVARAQVVPMTSRLKIATPAPPSTPVPTAPQPVAAAGPPAPKPAPVQAKAPESAPVATAPPVKADLAEQVKPEPPAEMDSSPAQESPMPFGVSKKMLWIAAAAVLVACSGALFIYPGVHRSGHAANPVAIPFALHVDRTATDLVLTWNRESDAIRNARHAVLAISDGDRQENVEMNMADLRNGSVVYTPITGDTSFRM